MNTSEVEALFARTVLGDYEDDGAWEAVNALRQDGSREIFDHAAAWCKSGEPLKRARGAAILCQLRRASVAKPQTENRHWDTPEWMFRDESYSLIAKMLESERDPVVLGVDWRRQQVAPGVLRPAGARRTIRA